MSRSIVHNSIEALSIALPALEEVIDPEIGINIVDLGLLRTFEFEEARIVCEMTLTTQHCPMGSYILMQVKERLEQAFPVCIADVKLTFNDPWTEKDISDRGRIILGR